MSQFVHLSVHSDLSLNNSLIGHKSLPKEVAKMGGEAVALSDFQNMFGMIGFYESCVKEGIKPIPATEVWIRDGEQSGLMTLIATSETGYKNLMALLSQIHEEGHEWGSGGTPACLKSWIESRSEGLVGLSGAVRGLAGQHLMSNKNHQAQDELQWMRSTFGERNAFVELQRSGTQEDEDHVHKAVKAASRMNMPVVATNNVRFLDPGDYEAHEIRVAISNRKTLTELRQQDRDDFTSHMFLKSADEMTELFDDIPSAVTNTVEIARRCSVDLDFENNYLPEFPLPEGQTEQQYLERVSYEGLDDRIAFDFGEDRVNDTEFRRVYDERLRYELDIIDSMGFPGYFLIVSDFIQWSKDNNIPVGPGRGSGAGSLVAYALKITDLDPLKYDLLFERFLNPERVSMPDFDVDFCMDRREEVIDYVAERYGHKAVSQIVTFGTMAARMVVRDVARVMGHPYSLGDRIAKLIPDVPGQKLGDALNDELALKSAYDNDPVVRDVFDKAMKLEGVARQTGKHAGGVLIAPGKLEEYTPTYNEPDGSGFVSQYDKTDVETAGLVKFDFLGLRTLTIIQDAVDAVNRDKAAEEDPLNILGIPLNDEDVFEVYREGKTTAVFQVESRGMRELLTRMRPDSFEDVIALVALYRPGPLQSGMVDNFINRKHGREEISYPDPSYQHELLKPILEPTYGIILYQEQVMQIAQSLAGYSLGEADLLRRAMGKKKPEEMEKQRSIFEKGAADNGIDPDLAIKIFDLVEKFAGYGFNKSHSAAYALISYQTAWMKVHYPSQFMAAVLSSDMNNTSKLVSFIEECKRMELEITAPSINRSEKDFVSGSDNEIIYGLGAIKGMGDKLIAALIKEREANGPFENFYSFVERVNPNKKALESAIRAGALDEFGHTRATLLHWAEDTQKLARKAKKSKAKDEYIDDMFSDQNQAFDIDHIKGFFPLSELYEKSLLSGERETLGHYMTSHPAISVREEMGSMLTGTLSDLMDQQMEDIENAPGKGAKQVCVAGVVMDSMIRFNTRGHTAIIKLDDGTSQIDLMIFNKTYHNCQHLLKNDALLVVDGKMMTDRKTGRQKLIANDVKDQRMVRDQLFSHISIDMPVEALTRETKQQVKELIDAQPRGLCQVKARVEITGQPREMTLGDRSIALTDPLIHQLNNLFGKDHVELVHRQMPFSQSNNVDSMDQYRLDQIREEGDRTRDERFEKMAEASKRARDVMLAS